MGFSLTASVFRCQYHFTIFFYMLLSPERQTVEAWEHSEKQCSIGNRGPLNGKVRSGFFFLVWRVYSLFTARLSVPNVTDMRDETCVRQADTISQLRVWFTHFMQRIRDQEHISKINCIPPLKKFCLRLVLPSFSIHVTSHFNLQ